MNGREKKKMLMKMRRYQKTKGATTKLSEKEFLS